MTVQGHPEFDGEIETKIVHSLAEKAVFSEAQAQEALGRVNNPHDGVVIGTTFLTFLLEE